MKSLSTDEEKFEAWTTFVTPTTVCLSAESSTRGSTSIVYGNDKEKRGQVVFAKVDNFGMCSFDVSNNLHYRKNVILKAKHQL